MDKAKIGQNIDAIRKERGWSKTDLADRVNMSYQSVCNHLKTGLMSLNALGNYAEVLGCTIGDLTDGVTDMKKFHLDANILSYYPYNLAYAVCCNGDFKNPETTAMARKMVYKVYVPAFMEAVQSLSKTEQDILNYRYKCGMTLKQTGMLLQISSSRVIENERKAFRKLNRCSCRQYWLFDVMKKAVDLQNRCNALAFQNQYLTKYFERANQQLGKQKERNNDSYILQKDDGIEMLDLSVRSYNCLNRSGISHLSQFDDMPVESLKRIRNLGQKSLNEILWSLELFNFKVDQDQIIRYIA